MMTCMAAIRPLTEEECVRLLRAGTFGRIAFVAPDGPRILPVNYAATEDAVLVRTDPGGSLARHAGGAALAFEVDHVDDVQWHGWSVVVRGTGELLDRDERDRVEASLPRPRPWPSEERTAILRVRWTSISGRKVGTGWDVREGHPIRWPG
jgi:nitroimidazol reductase NimA-like FMN-containing flavoprotein (pyridoxamine 5'-phosphate oxidase superfamily)